VGIFQISHLCSTLENAEDHHNLHKSQPLCHIRDQTNTVYFKFLQPENGLYEGSTMFSDMIDKSIIGEDNETASHINCSTVLRDILGISCVMQNDRNDGLISISPGTVRV
jgi:hypothetical protein